MNCLNTVGAGINEYVLIPVVATITGTYASSVNGSLYTYTFNSGTNTIKFNTNIANMYVIVVGGGGGGSAGNGGAAGGSGGAGGGFGFWQFSYTAEVLYKLSVGGISSPSATGSTTSFLSNSSSIGVTATGGGGATLNNEPSPGTFDKTGTASGLITQRTGGNGGTGNGGSGGDSSDSITVLNTTYNYGGGGKAGQNRASAGGNAGANGIGGTSLTNANNGGSASTPGSGGGGGSAAGSRPSQYGGTGGAGLIIVTFNYP